MVDRELNDMPFKDKTVGACGERVFGLRLHHLEDRYDLDPLAEVRAPPGGEIMLHAVSMGGTKLQRDDQLGQVVAEHVELAMTEGLFGGRVELDDGALLVDGDEALVAYYTRPTVWARDSEVMLKVFKVGQFYA